MYNMKMKVLSLLLMSSLALSVAEKLVKIEGTSGEISDIVIDSEGAWYIVKDKTLFHSVDEGKTLNKIELPSKESVYTGLGIDLFDNIYVQDYNLSVFIVAPTINETFVFQELTLAYGKERLVSRPFSRYISNKAYFATRSGLMTLENGALICKPMASAPNTKGSITHMVPYKTGSEATLFYSGGYPRHWVFYKEISSESPKLQLKSFVKYMNEGFGYTFFIVNGEKIIRLIAFHWRSKIIDGLDASNIINQTDFVTYSRKYGKAYIFSNVNNSGNVYDMGEKRVSGDYEYNVAPMLQLSNVRIICSARTNENDNKIYFGTSDGIYQLIDITPIRK